MIFPGQGGLQPESERIHVVYDRRTGHVVHVHRTLTFPGGTARPISEEPARALEMAGRHGHDVERLQVLRVETFDGRVALRVDVRTQQLVPADPGKARGNAKPAAAKASKRSRTPAPRRASRRRG